MKTLGEKILASESGDPGIDLEQRENHSGE